MADYIVHYTHGRDHGCYRSCWCSHPVSIQGISFIPSYPPKLDKTKETQWGLYSFGCAAFLFIVWNVGFVAPKYAKALGSDIHRTFLLCGVWTLSLWFLYPVAWGLCEGGNVISPDSEAAFYGVLDVLAKPGFGALLIWGHRGIDPARLG
jgi:bacteriorhodopsin